MSVTWQLVPHDSSMSGPIEVTSFMGAGGTVAAFRGSSRDMQSTPLMLECDIRFGASGKAVWSGPVRFDQRKDGETEFSLVLRASSGDMLQWSLLPRFFSVTDGAYEPLDHKEVGRLLDDLLQFKDAIRALMFAPDGVSNKPIKCTVEMEEIAETDAVLVHMACTHEQTATLLKQPCVLAIELFAVSYNVVGVIDEVEGSTAIFTLSSHLYRDQRRACRQFLADPIKTPEGDIVEISDVGARLHGPSLADKKIGDTIQIHLPGVGMANFQIMHSSTTEDETHELGCLIMPDQTSVSNWTRFLLREQYPLLCFRTTKDHGRFRTLLSETGFSSRDFDELNQITRQMVDLEWTLIDNECPTYGATVLAMDDQIPVGTIGVTRVGKTAWNSQLLATSKDPRHLPQTRALFAWRTRFILQQPEGEYNIGFFSRDKAFLDRFYRKFYLQEQDAHPTEIMWDEWHLYTMICATSSVSVSPPELQQPSAPEPQHLVAALSAGGSHSCTPQIATLSEGTIVSGRPFQHLCQYFSSAWFPKPSTAAQHEVVHDFFRGQRVYTIRTKEELPHEALHNSPDIRVVDDGWDVIWICRRSLLTRFMANSLRALELMHRKYGAKDVA